MTIAFEAKNRLLVVGILFFTRYRWKFQEKVLAPPPAPPACGCTEIYIPLFFLEKNVITLPNPNPHPQKILLKNNIILDASTFDNSYTNLIQALDVTPLHLLLFEKQCIHHYSRFLLTYSQ